MSKSKSSYPTTRVVFLTKTGFLGTINPEKHSSYAFARFSANNST